MVQSISNWTSSAIHRESCTPTPYAHLFFASPGGIRKSGWPASITDTYTLSLSTIDLVQYLPYLAETVGISTYNLTPASLRQLATMKNLHRIHLVDRSDPLPSGEPAPVPLALVETAKRVLRANGRPYSDRFVTVKAWEEPAGTTVLRNTDWNSASLQSIPAGVSLPYTFSNAIAIQGPKYEFFRLPVPIFLLPRFPTAPGVNYDAVQPMIDDSLDIAGVDHLLPTRQSAPCNPSA
ncbi:hypothetical protein DFH08DRAFT_826033 [Mycena albidolilacea]|uniref:Uncharacterized protein n=1 Tax=Mycena albidolilacea TaxID=1033008 RepID=A0AAD7E8K1_9AGAR|nr:hypothetical protein DFH08DRAFT_826033 [Mycena albidolilacea]